MFAFSSIRVISNYDAMFCFAAVGGIQRFDYRLAFTRTGEMEDESVSMICRQRSDLRYNIIIQEADEVTPGNNVASALSVTMSMKHYKIIQHNDAAVGTHGTWLGGNRSRHYEAKYR